MLCFWSGFFVPVSVRKREMHNKTGSLPWPHRESVVARQNKAEIYVINILYRSRLSWDGLWRPPPKPKLDFGYLCRRYLLNQNLIQWCVWYTQLMPSWKQLVAICLQNPITSPPPVGQILLSGSLLWSPRNEFCWYLCDCCWIWAHERHTGCSWRRGWLEIFSWNGFPLENVSFSKPKLFVGTYVPHATKMVFLVTVGERGNKEKQRKEGKNSSLLQN